MTTMSDKVTTDETTIKQETSIVMSTSAISSNVMNQDKIDV